MVVLSLSAAATAAALVVAGYFAARCAAGYAGSRLTIVFSLVAFAVLLLAAGAIGGLLAKAGSARTLQALGLASSLVSLATAALILPRVFAAPATASHVGWILSLAATAGLSTAGFLQQAPVVAAALRLSSALCLALGMGLCWRAWRRAGARDAAAGARAAEAVAGGASGGRVGRSDVSRLQHVFSFTAAGVRTLVRTVAGARAERAVIKAFNRDARGAGWPVSLSTSGVDDEITGDVALSLRANLYASALNLLLDFAARQIGSPLVAGGVRTVSGTLPADERELAAASLFPKLRYPVLPGSARRDECGYDTDLLRQIPLFAGMDETEIDLVCANLVLERYRTGHVVMRQGEPGDKFYIIREGHIEVSQVDAEGPPRIVNSLDRGGCFGEMALLNDSPRNATCRATMRTELLSLRRADFRRLIGGDLEWQARMDDRLGRIALLRGVPVFAPLDVHQLGLIAAKLHGAQLRQGEVLLREGEPGDAFYIIRSGRVAITSMVAGVETGAEERGPGEYVGEISLLQRGPRTATVRALTEVDVWVLDAADFDHVVARQADTRPLLQREAARRLRNLGRDDGHSA